MVKTFVSSMAMASASIEDSTFLLQLGVPHRQVQNPDTASHEDVSALETQVDLAAAMSTNCIGGEFGPKPQCAFKCWGLPNCKAGMKCAYHHRCQKVCGNRMCHWESYRRRSPPAPPPPPPPPPPTPPPPPCQDKHAECTQAAEDPSLCSEWHVWTRCQLACPKAASRGHCTPPPCEDKKAECTQAAEDPSLCSEWHVWTRCEVACPRAASLGHCMMLPLETGRYIIKPAMHASECMILGSDGLERSGGPCGQSSMEDLNQNEQAIWLLEQVVPNTTQYVIKPAKNTAECMILGSHGEDQNATPYNWGFSGPCGHRSREKLLQNQQAIWSIEQVAKHKFVIKPAKHPTQCMILAANGNNTHASRHSWGSGGPCGLNSMDDLINNRQALWNFERVPLAASASSASTAVESPPLTLLQKASDTIDTMPDAIGKGRATKFSNNISAVADDE